MAKRELHAKAIEMRKQGMSYSQIKSALGVNKSTLSGWLKDYPLPEERLRELRDFSEIRIERYRETQSKKKESRQAKVYEEAAKNIGSLSDRELFIAGLFLYWGEGGKTKHTTVTVTNTDPSVLLFFKQWLNLLGVENKKMKVRLQLYADMNPDTELEYWSSILELPTSAFRKPYIKSSNRLNLTYKQRFTHGTCNLLYDNREIAEYVLLGLEWLRDSLIAPNPQT